MYNHSKNETITFSPLTFRSLQIGSALALSEIVNAPNEFRSKAPHLVVQHLDWIQTRYLFVRVGTNIKLEDDKTPKHVHEQDPSMTPSGSEGRLLIPARAVARSGNRKKMDAPKTGFLHKILATSTAKDPLYLDGDDMVVDDDDGASVATAVADLEILFPADTMAGASNNKRKANQIAVQETDFVPGNLDHSALPMIASPGWATTQATKRLQKDLNAVLKVQETTPLHELGWYVDSEFVTNVYQWIVELHSFDKDLPLAADMKSKGLKSIVLELRFGKDYPTSPPFVRVIRPRFLLFTQGGGGHVTAGGALCMEVSRYSSNRQLQYS